MERQEAERHTWNTYRMDKGISKDTVHTEKKTRTRKRDRGKGRDAESHRGTR